MVVRVQEFTEKRKTWKEQHDISLATYLSKCKLKETAGMEVIFADSTRLSVKHIFDSQERIDIVQVYSVSEKMLEGFMTINPKAPKQQNRSHIMLQKPMILWSGLPKYLRCQEKGIRIARFGLWWYGKKSSTRQEIKHTNIIKIFRSCNIESGEQRYE